MHAEVVYIDYRLEVVEAKEIYQSVIPTSSSSKQQIFTPSSFLPSK